MSKGSSPKKTKVIPRKRSRCLEPLPVQLIALEKIDPSPLNRPARNIDDLVMSVREHGIQQPIKLRPQGSRFEIVHGERRFRAARKVGLKEIPATVEDLSDEDAQEIRIVENICREDPHPLEEAEAHEELLAMKDGHGEPAHTAETLAKLVDRSAHYVYVRLKLTALGTAMREAFRSGELTTTTAFLVARSIPSELQNEALAEFRQIFSDREKGAAFPSQDLERAPFKLKDARLVPEAGPCTTCPKRSGNQPVLFTEETPKDTCTDASCFRGKLSAHRKNLADDVLSKGGVVLTEHQSSEVHRGAHQFLRNSKHVDIAPCLDDPNGRTWCNLLGDLCPKLTLATSPRGVPHALVLRNEALSALKQAGVDLAQIRKDTASAPDAAPGGPTHDDHGSDTDHAQRERRMYALLGFDYRVKFEALVKPGEPLPEEGLFVGCAGGTEISAALTRGLEITRGHPGALRKADLVLVTDGGSDPSAAPKVREEAAELGVTILGLGIGVEQEWLLPWCDEVQAVSNLSTVDDAIAAPLFAA